MFVEDFSRIIIILANPMRMAHVLSQGFYVSDDTPPQAHERGSTNLLAQVLNTRSPIPPLAPPPFLVSVR